MRPMYVYFRFLMVIQDFKRKREKKKEKEQLKIERENKRQRGKEKRDKGSNFQGEVFLTSISCFLWLWVNWKKIVF